MFSPVWHDVQDVMTRDIFRDVFAAHDNDLRRPEDYITTHILKPRLSCMVYLLLKTNYLWLIVLRVVYRSWTMILLSLQ